MSEPGTWVKIGETHKMTTLFQKGLYAKYAVMEMVCRSGMRKYKEVLICTWSDKMDVNSPQG